MSKLGLKSLCIVLFALIAGISPAQTKTLNDIAAQRLNEAGAILKQVDATLQQAGLSVEELQKLHDQIAPLDMQVQTVLDHLTARLTAEKTQLDQLGAAPGAKAPPESPQIAAERTKRQKAFDEVDALVKNGKLLAVQITQAEDQIGARQRARLEQSLFQRGPSIINPALWLDSLSELPRDLGAIQSLLASWLASLPAQLSVGRLAVLVVALALILALYWPLSRFARRVTFRSTTATDLTLLQKILGAWRVGLVVAGFPIAAAWAIGAILQGFGVLDTATALPQTLFIGVARVALAVGVAQALLAPNRQAWRLPRIDDETSEHILHTVFIVALLVSISRVIEAVGNVVNVSATMETWLRGLGALLVGLVLAASLWIGSRDDDESEEIFGPRTSAGHDWYGLLRVVLWIAIVAVFTAVFTGLMGLARFLVDQILWIGGTAAITVLLVILIEEVIGAALKPTTRFGHSLMLTTGLHRDSFEQLSILLSGASRVAVVVIATLIAIAPWGVQSSDVTGYVYSAFFGFKIGSVTISLSRLVVALLIFLAGYVATRTIENWLEVSFLPATRLDQGLRNALRTSVGYIGRIIALGLALGYLGLDFQKLAIVAGALSVGIGFGLQSIVNNFVSGLILLWERAIRVGDWISVGPNEGLVRRIHVRSTEIETFDCAAVVIPNSDLVAGVVKNFMRMDRTGRVQINIPVNAAADPQKARDALLEVAKSHKQVMQKPAPQVVLAEITAGAFNFELYCFIIDIGAIASVKSDLNFEIYRRFKAENLFAAPAPVLNVSLPEIEKQGLVLKGNSGDGADKRESTSAAP